MQSIWKKFTAAMMACLLLSVCAGCSGGGSDKDNTDTKNQEAVKSQKAINKDELLGTWKATGEEKGTITFSADGTFKEEGNAMGVEMSGTYTIDTTNNKLVCSEKENGLTFAYNCTIEGNKLTLQLDRGKPRNFQK